MIGEVEIIGGHGVGKRGAAREAYLMSIVADPRVCLFVCLFVGVIEWGRALFCEE